MSTTERQLALARRWMSKARTDLALARVVLDRGPDMDPWACCFHAQQAAEKAMKAILVSRGIEPPHTHDLGAIAATVPTDVSLDVTADDLATLTTYATGPRYVLDAGPEAEEPTWDEAERAVGIADQVLASSRAFLSVP
jgi:HEPN domain-containing protein